MRLGRRQAKWPAIGRAKRPCACRHEGCILGPGYSPITMLLYLAYALNCHQLRQRSYFLFGPYGGDPPPKSC